MSGGSQRETLEQAFRRFENAAHHLESSHSGLQAEVQRLERKLLDANRRLEAVFDALSSGVAVVSSDGTVSRTNRAFEHLQLDERALAELFDGNPCSGGSARLRQETPEGTRHLAATLVPVGDEEGNHVLGIQDVTEIRREEEEGGRRRRLEALGRMAAELAHEVRNPLGSIRLFACMLQEDLEDDPGKKKMTEQILSATAGLEATVSNLLAFAAPARADHRRVDLAELAREACALLSPACSVRGVSLEGPPADVTCPLSADPEALRQVLLNLIGNALAATDTGGSIRIDATLDDGHAVLSIADSGRGIDPEDLPRVFDPFFSRTDGGTGLGLSIVHGILERHGGKISLDSRAGQGTRVRVELPSEVAGRTPAEAPHA